jgi:hypothetical protein
VDDDATGFDGERRTEDGMATGAKSRPLQATEGRHCLPAAMRTGVWIYEPPSTPDYAKRNVDDAIPSEEPRLADAARLVAVQSPAPALP